MSGTGGFPRGGTILAMLLVAGALLRIGAAWRHVAIDYDEGRYLDNAVHLNEGHGLASSYTSHFFRAAPPIHPEDVSAPAFPWMLAAAFRLTGPSHRVAQGISLAAGLAMIALTWAAGMRYFDELTARLGATLVALHPDQILFSSWAMTETLYGALFLAILLIARRRGAGGAIASGAACGLLYLLRANGLAVAGALGLTLLSGGGEEGGWRPRLGRAAFFALAFLLVVSPWLIRNEAVFGSPTWTAMKHVAWTQSGRDLFTRAQEPPGAGAYLREHGAAGLAANLARRALRAAEFLVAGDAKGYNLLCALFPLALLGTWRQAPLRAGHLSVLLTALLLVGVPTWTGALSRYLAPVRPWIYLSVIGGAILLGRRLAKRFPARRSIPAAAGSGMVIACCLIAALSLGPLRDRMAVDEGEKDALAREASAWLSERTPAGAVLLEGAWVHQYAFAHRRAVVWVPVGGLDELRRTAAEYGARYLVLSAELLRFHPELAEHFTAGPEGIGAGALPPGFREAFAGRGRRIVIYELPEAGA